MECLYSSIKCPIEGNGPNCEDCNIYKDYDPDSHSCRANSDGYGYCSVCGSIIHGSLADYEIHGYDPC